MLRVVEYSKGASRGDDLASVDLIELAKQNPAAVEKYTIRQIVGICGDGDLRDNSACSHHLREFLALQSNDRLADYAHFCLDEGFTKSGFVLQDIVNEIGKRLGYQVLQNGRYQGVVNQAGFDGLWFDGTNHIVVEVKTTDAYRINLDTISAYAEKVNSSVGGGTPKDTSLLIVVGRQDTGDLEAQVRGSRHAWSTRLVSVDALIKLMFTKEEVDDKALIERIRRILLPFEYTRVDNIVDLVFETQQETDQKAQTSAELELEEEAEPTDQGHGVWEFTPRHELDVKRLQIVDAFFKSKNADPIRRTRTNFSDQMDQIGVTCAVSKRYKREYQPYWYALHPKWLEFMQSVGKGYFVLGCMDRDEAYALPRVFIEENLEALNTTQKGAKKYWHIALTIDNGSLALNLSSISKKIDLTPYAFKL
jgi:hypothetical protein